MGKTKKAAMRPQKCPVGDDGRDGSGSDKEATPITYVKKTTAAKDSAVKGTGTLLAPAKSPLPAEKRKRKVIHSNSSALTGPSRSGKEKQQSSQKKKSRSAGRSEETSSETSAVAENARHELENSAEDVHSEENLETSMGGSRASKRRKSTNREYTESDCRKQVASLKLAEKRPPKAMTAETFASTFQLPHEGINSHKLKIGKDITLGTVEAVFGEEKSRNGFSLAEKFSGTQRKEAERLYCLCYQRPYAPTHVAKEFAIGFVLDNVNNENVNWVEFAAETNAAQWKSYNRRLRTWIHRLATVTNVPMSDIYKEEGLSEFTYIRGEKCPGGNNQDEVKAEPASKIAMQTGTSAEDARSCDSDVLAARKADVITLIEQLEAKLKGNEEEVQDKKTKVHQAGVHWEACSQMVQQFRASLEEAGQDCSALAVEEDIESAIRHSPIGPVLKMYYSNVKKLNSFQESLTRSEGELHQASSAVIANCSRLAALKAYLVGLEGGNDVAVMRPLLLCYKNDLVALSIVAPVLPLPLECFVCLDGFPFRDVVLSVCQHVYHPWCASNWFKSNVTCAVPECGVVPPHWYNSWGFGNYDQILQGNVPSALPTSNNPTITAPKLIGRPFKRGLGDSKFFEGAPSMSACDSTVSKCLEEGRQYGIPQVLRLGMESADFTTSPAPMDFDSSAGPFDSRLSTPCSKLNRAGTVTSEVQMSPPVVEPPICTPVPDASQNSTVPAHSHANNTIDGEATELEEAMVDAVEGRTTEEDVDDDAGVEDLDPALEDTMKEEGHEQWKPTFEDPTAKAAQFFDLQEDDPLVDTKTDTREDPGEVTVAVDTEAVIPALLLQRLERQSILSALAPTADKLTADAKENVTSMAEDPYSMNFHRTSKRVKKGLESAETGTSPTKERKGRQNKGVGDVPAMSSPVKSSGKERAARMEAAGSTSLL